MYVGMAASGNPEAKGIAGQARNDVGFKVITISAYPYRSGNFTQFF